MKAMKQDSQPMRFSNGFTDDYDYNPLLETTDPKIYKTHMKEDKRMERMKKCGPYTQIPDLDEYPDIDMSQFAGELKPKNPLLTSYLNGEMQRREIDEKIRIQEQTTMDEKRMHRLFELGHEIQVLKQARDLYLSGVPLSTIVSELNSRHVQEMLQQSNAGIGLINDVDYIFNHAPNRQKLNDLTTNAQAKGLGRALERFINHVESAPSGENPDFGMRPFSEGDLDQESESGATDLFEGFDVLARPQDAPLPELGSVMQSPASGPAQNALNASGIELGDITDVLQRQALRDATTDLTPDAPQSAEPTAMPKGASDELAREVLATETKADDPALDEETEAELDKMVGDSQSMALVKAQSQREFESRQEMERRALEAMLKPSPSRPLTEAMLTGEKEKVEEEPEDDDGEGAGEGADPEESLPTIITGIATYKGGKKFQERLKAGAQREAGGNVDAKVLPFIRRQYQAMREEFDEADLKPRPDDIATDREQFNKEIYQMRAYSFWLINKDPKKAKQIAVNTFLINGGNPRLLRKMGVPQKKIKRVYESNPA